jgi:hypothetical protein
MIEQATKEQLAGTERILALQAFQSVRHHGELPLSELHKQLTATQLDAEQLALLRDGTEALVGVLAAVSEIDGERDYPMQ